MPSVLQVVYSRCSTIAKLQQQSTSHKKMLFRFVVFSVTDFTVVKSFYLWVLSGKGRGLATRRSEEKSVIPHSVRRACVRGEREASSLVCELPRDDSRNVLISQPSRAEAPSTTAPTPISFGTRQPQELSAARQTTASHPARDGSGWFVEPRCAPSLRSSSSRRSRR